MSCPLLSAQIQKKWDQNEKNPEKLSAQDKPAEGEKQAEEEPGGSRLNERTAGE